MNYENVGNNKVCVNCEFEKKNDKTDGISIYRGKNEN